jgi:hypothetical protein
MPRRTVAIFAAGLLVAVLGFSTSGFAKDKNNAILPAYVLSARTVAVIIDPGAGISIDDPRANDVARADVEAALRTWGRFEPVQTGLPADLIIVVRRGHGRLVDSTIHDPRQNDPMSPVGGIGAENSRPPTQPGSVSNPGSISNPGATNDRPGPQTEIGGADDSFVVYRGDVDKPLDTSPAWRYTASDALQPHSVPAVDKFRKAIAEAEKAATKGP